MGKKSRKKNKSGSSHKERVQERRSRASAACTALPLITDRNQARHHDIYPRDRVWIEDEGSYIRALCRENNGSTIVVMFMLGDTLVMELAVPSASVKDTAERNLLFKKGDRLVFRPSDQNQ